MTDAAKFLSVLIRLKAQNFKSLVDFDMALPRLTVLFGPNAAGKSNVIDGLIVLSRLASERTAVDALADPVRGHPFELLSLPTGGLPELLKGGTRHFELQADLRLPRWSQLLRYGARLAVEPRTGEVRVASEYLGRIYASGAAVGNPKIETVGKEIRIRREAQGRPINEPTGLNFTQLSNLRLSGDAYATIEAVRSALSGIRTYYLDPRVAMRQGLPPREVEDIGPLGADLAPFLFRVKHTDPKAFAAINRAVRSIIPSIERIDADLDDQRGIIDIFVKQDGIEYPSRIVSEGTLRVLALCCIVLNPWPGTLVAFEEPENGVHPRRLELIARLLFSLSVERGQQVIVTTHSPLFAEQVLRLQRERSQRDARLLIVGRRGLNTVWHPFESSTLFSDEELQDAISSRREDGLFEGLVLRGLVDA